MTSMSFTAKKRRPVNPNPSKYPNPALCPPLESYLQSGPSNCTDLTKHVGAQVDGTRAYGLPGQGPGFAR